MTRSLRWLPLLVGLAAFVWLCAQFGLGDVLLALRRVQPGYVLLYVGAAVAVLVGYSARWELVTRAVGARVPLRRLLAARLIGDAAGALLPGGKVGGDPVRAALVYADGVSGVRAGAGVAIDRVMELIGNSLCAITYVAVFSLTRAVGASQRGPLALLAAMLFPLLALVITVAMLWRGQRPFTPVFDGVAQRLRALQPIGAVVRRTEDQLIDFFRDHPLVFVAGLLASLLIELMTIVEYHVMLAAFGVALDVPTLLMVLLASGMARAVPTPAGLGALEAGQVTVVGLASGRPEVGFVVGVVLRLHETLWTLIGVGVLSFQGMSVARLRTLATRKAVA